MELWDLYTKDRTPLGRTHARGREIPEGCFHLVVHVWLRSSKGEYLISQRAEDRPTFPLMWETTGGSVVSGEDSLAGALRETREELGIQLRAEDAELLFSQVRDWVDGKRFGDILDVWEFPYEGEAHLERAEGEVRQTRWAAKDRIREMLAAGEFVDTLAYILER